MAPGNNQGAQAASKVQAEKIKENEEEQEQQLKEQRDKFFAQISYPIIKSQQEMQSETNRLVRSLQQNITGLTALVQSQQEDITHLREALTNNNKCCNIQ